MFDRDSVDGPGSDDRVVRACRTLDDIVVEGTRTRWLHQTMAGFGQVPDEFEGIRLTFCVSAEDKSARLPDDVRVSLPLGAGRAADVVV